MALEVKVFREFREYQAKVMFGLSWRQLAVVAVAIPVIGGLYALMLVNGLGDLGVYVVAVLMVPFALVGWWRRLGVPFEKYVGFMWRHHHSPSLHIYRQTGWISDDAYETNHAAGKQAIAAWEATN